VNKILKLLYRPFIMLFAKLFPNQYVKLIGVNLKGKLYLYGNPYSMFSTEPWLITIGDNVYITSGVQFITHDGGTLIFRNKIPDLEITKPIVIGDNVYIGMKSIILPGVNIGSNYIIGAGSVVTRNLESGGVYAGAPARYIKSIEEYLEKAKKDSLHLGHLKGRQKAKSLKKFYLHKN